MLKKITVWLLALALATSPALAGSSTIAVTPGSGATYQVITNGSSNFVGEFGLCDGVAAAQCVAVKAASTAAVATDPALVVAISPNNTVAATQSGNWNLVNVSGTVSLPTNAAQETGGNLATLAGAVTSSVIQSNTKQVNGATTPVGAGLASTAGVQRVAAAQDTTTIAGSAPGTAGTASAQVVTVQGVASMTPLLANPGTAANWGILADNAAWTAGTTPQAAIGCEYTSGGATALTTGHVGTPGCTSARGLFADLESVGGTALGAVISNLGTLASGTPATLNVNNYMVGCASTVCNPNGSAVSASSAPIVIASDQAAVAVKAASGAIASGSISSGAAVSGAFVAGAIADLSHGQAAAAASVPVVLANNQTAADPCMFQAKTKVAFSTSSGSTQLVALSGSTKIYVCAVHFTSTAADTISFIEGTGTACATSATAVDGSTTAANGLDYSATGGMALGSGVGTVMNTSVAGDELCLLQTGTTKIAGNLEVVQQ